MLGGVLKKIDWSRAWYFLLEMNNSEKEGTSVQDPPTISEPQKATAFERWRKNAWRAAGFGLSDDEYQESMTRSCEKQRDYLMSYSAYHVLLWMLFEFLSIDIST